MNYLPTSPFSHRFPQWKAGFTLVEILVAVAVLVVILLMLGQILILVSQTSSDGRSEVNDFAKSRVMLDMFASDIEAGLFRNDVPAFPTSPAPAAPNPSGPNIEFYTKRQGIPSTTGTTVRYVSLVQYSYNTDQSTPTSMTTLDRGDMAILWTSPTSLISFGSTNPASFGVNTSALTARNTAPGVIDYRVLFVYADGTVNTTYPYPPPYPSAFSSAPSLCAVALTLAVVDDNSLLQLSLSQVQALRTALDGAVSGTRSVKADWETYLNNMNWTSYPKTTRAGLKVFERYVIITNF